MGFGPPIPQLQASPIPLDDHGHVLGLAPADVSAVALAVQDQVSVNDGNEN